ncbi:hypothetical protein CRG98_008979 [Punica granatum]|uniref:Uncharacterized protein n=1 Tax=Punica granatum TaxID=22663 RepID=A0A2I0KSD7_PUNGR|nr:hypothetical protein CRG98_008979 [Punica granatum]
MAANTPQPSQPSPVTRSVASNCVLSRTPSPVQSRAQSRVQSRTVATSSYLGVQQPPAATESIQQPSVEATLCPRMTGSSREEPRRAEPSSNH